MAKWGQGDPRWIVEERPDATNVNNYHWVTSDCSNFSREKITSLLNEVRLEDENGNKVSIVEVSTIDGEANANVRKAKLILFYEWVIKGKWSGKLKDGEHEIKGEFEIPNLSEENDPNEIDVQVNYTENSEHDKNELIKELFRVKGTKLIQQQLGVYIKDLKEKYAKNLLLPTKNNNSNNQSNKPDSVKSTTRITNDKPSNNVTSNSKNQLTNLKSLVLEEEFKCTSNDFYNALTSVELLSAFTHDKASCISKVGGSFVLFGGNVEGEFTELEQGKLIKQKWRFKNWPKDHYSNVTFKIEPKNDSILVKLEQNNIPADDFERTNNGWKRYYFDSLKRTLGFGSTLF